MHSLSSALLISLSLLSLAGTLRAEELKVEELLARYDKAMSSLEDVQAQASLKLNLTLGLFPYKENLAGRYYYLKPDKHRLEFDNAPSYFDKMPSMFQWNLPALDKYRAKVKGPFSQGSSMTYQLLFLPQNAASSTQSVLCTFGAGSWRLLKQETSYKDGGTVALSFDYLDDSKLPVLDKVDASVSLPSYSLNGGATISFARQETNKGLDESVFQGPKD